MQKLTLIKIDEDFRVGLGDIGIATAAFTALIAIFGMDTPKQKALEAANLFAVGIPTLFFAVFLSRIGSDILQATKPSPRISILMNLFFYYICRLSLLIGNLYCCIGIYKVFESISSQSAITFSNIVKPFFVTLLILGLVLDFFEDKKSRNN